MDVERTMEFIVETLARVTTRLEALTERMDRAEERASLADARAERTDARLDRAIRLAAAQLNTEEKMQQLNDAFRRFLESQDGGGNGSHGNRL
jgi:hypothetical protein